MRLVEKLLSNLTIGVGTIVLTLMMIQISVDVITRNLFGAGFPGTTELVGRYYMVAVSFVPLAFTELRRRHIETTVLTDLLPKSLMPPLLGAGFVLSAVVYGAMATASFTEAARQTSNGSFVEAGLIRFLTWPSYWILPISFGLMTLICLGRILQVSMGRLDFIENSSADELSLIESGK